MAPRRTYALIAVLVVSLALAGCLGADGGDGDVGNQSQAEELRTGAVDAMAEVDSYTMDMTVEVSAAGSDAVAQSQETTMRIDQADRRASIEQTIRAEGQEQTTQAYLVDDAMHVQQAGTWQTQQLPEDPWEGAGAGQTNQLQALEEANVTHAGNETVDGVETEVLEIEMSGDAYEQLLREQANASGTAGLGQLLELIDVQSVEIRQYVATEEPHYVHRVESDISMAQMGQRIDSSTVATFDDFEEDVTVELPADLPDD